MPAPATPSPAKVSPKPLQSSLNPLPPHPSSLRLQFQVVLSEPGKDLLKMMQVLQLLFFCWSQSIHLGQLQGLSHSHRHLHCTHLHQSWSGGLQHHVLATLHL
ncbi:hypothetical protein AAFF_G00146200 [Aldrovandia affinis]|uniref:Uncharacterized protein n=1 Tax=Aldrovandia affinis TaxID=143900 RepID=A0AAD7RPU1_9TELE|nr:hypothetical protein AAFF_G00146200 [Aldrovandia affinis]